MANCELTQRSDVDKIPSTARPLLHEATRTNVARFFRKSTVMSSEGTPQQRQKRTLLFLFEGRLQTDTLIDWLRITETPEHQGWSCQSVVSIRTDSFTGGSGSTQVARTEGFTSEGSNGT